MDKSNGVHKGNGKHANGLPEHTERLQRGLYNVTEVINRMTEGRDPYTAGHEKRVAQLCVAIAQTLGLDDDVVEGLRVAAAVHDLGKFQVPSEILYKPGSLNAAEISLIRMHPEAGYDILREIEFPWPVADVVYQHHERMDGSGYPRGLTYKDILLEPRVLAVADVVEAMSSHRPYHPACSLDRALEEIDEGRGTRYDPDVVDACVKQFQETGYTVEGMN